MAGCLDEEAALDFVQGRFSESRVREIDEHVDRCQRCRLILGEATRALRSRATGSTSSTGSMALTRFAPGEKLAARYRILRFIARGGMGEVYEAHDLMLNTRVALKTLAATISDDTYAIRRLKQEVNLARLITHPNVCRIFDLGVHEQSGAPSVPGVLFITMELIDGASLGERVRRDGPMAGAAVLSVTRAIAAAVGAAHRAKVIHRDLKSDNVMLAVDEHGGQRVVVMDFGLARAASPAPDGNSTDGPSLAGTLAYMAPEQLEGKSVSTATDVYALGVMMFEMLTGRLPFRGEPALAAAWKRVTHPAPALGEAEPGADPRWRPIVASCLERDPLRRPRSADEVARLLQPLDSVSDTLPAISVSTPVGSARVGRRTGIAVAAVSALIAIGGARAVLRGTRHQPQRAMAGSAHVPETTAPTTRAQAAKPAASTAKPAISTADLTAPSRASSASVKTAIGGAPPLTTVAPAGPNSGTVAVVPHRYRSVKTRTQPADRSRTASGAEAGPVDRSRKLLEEVARRPSDDPDDGFVAP